MRRPQWIAALLLAMLVAAAFAWLGQWQMGHAIRDNVDELTKTEQVRSLDELTEAIAGIPEIAAGAVVSLDGTFIPGDYAVVSNRMNHGPNDASDGAERTQGSWVVGHLQRAGEGDTGPSSLSVALGWAPNEAAANAAIERISLLPVAELEIEGRYLPSESPIIPRPDADPHVMTTMVPAHLANLWNTPPTGPIYGGYLVLHDSNATVSAMLSDAGLVAIDSVAPSAPEKVSWLNVFYAIEWVVFAGIALFLWYRLARDAWEKEHEMKLLIAAEAAKADDATAKAAVIEQQNQP